MKPCDPDRLVARVRSSSGAIRTPDEGRDMSAGDAIDELTPREREVLALLAKVTAPPTSRTSSSSAHARSAPVQHPLEARRPQPHTGRGASPRTESDLTGHGRDATVAPRRCRGRPSARAREGTALRRQCQRRRDRRGSGRHVLRRLNACSANRRRARPRLERGSPGRGGNVRATTHADVRPTGARSDRGCARHLHPAGGNHSSGRSGASRGS
jgi:hypothetical protein